MRLLTLTLFAIGAVFALSSPASAQTAGDMQNPQPAVLDPTAPDLSALDPSALDPSALDPAILAGGAQDVLARAPDREIDGLFQALHGSMQQPKEAEAICALFQDDADRSIDGFNAAAMGLGERSRQRFADAVAGVLVAGLQGQPQAWNREDAAQALKSNGTRAAMLHDGFGAGFTQGATSQARCRSLRQMLDVLADRPLDERVLVTRLLLDQGLQQLTSR